MPATVDSVFRLSAEPAKKELRALKKLGVETDGVFKNLGKTIDSMANARRLERLDRVKKRVKSISTQAEETATKFDASSKKIAKSVTTLDAKTKPVLENIERNLEKIELDPAQFAAQAQIIKHEINSIDSTLRKSQIEQTLGSWNKTINGGGMGAGSSVAGGLAGGFGRLASNIGLFGAAAITAAPAVVALTGAVSALVGSLGAGLLGGAAIGGTSLGAGLVGGLGILSIIKPAVKDIKEATKAQKAYNVAVQQYGDKSKQAQDALAKRDAAFKGKRGLKDVVGGLQGIGPRWRRQTKEGRESFFETLGVGLKELNILMPDFAKVANSAMGSAGKAFQKVFKDMDSPGFRKFLDVMSGTFNQSIGPALSGLSAFAAGLGKIAIATSPHVVEMFQSFDHWAQNWNARQNDASRLNKQVGGLVDHFKTWARLLKSTGNLTVAFFGAGSSQGMDVAQSITDQFDTWTRWIKDNPAKIQSFFSRTIGAAGQLAKALGHISVTLGKMADDLLPLVAGMSQFTSLLGNAGLLGPALAYAGYRRATKGVFGGTPGVPGAGPGGPGGAGPGLIPILAGGRAAAGLRGGAAGRAGRGMYGGAFRYGAPTSQLGSRAYGLGRLAKPLSAVRGVAGPFLGITAALSVAGDHTEPGWGNRALQSTTFGLYKAPKTTDTHKQEGIDAAQAIAQSVSGKIQSVSGQRARINQHINRLRGEVLPGATDETRDSFNPAKWFRGSRANESRVREEIKTLAAIRKQLDGQLEVQAVARAQRTGARQAGALQRSFAIAMRHTKDPQKAMDMMGDQLDARLKKLRPEGQKVLSQSMIDWGRQMARDNPKLRKPFHEMLQAMKRDWKNTGSDLVLIGGHVYDNLSAVWSNLRKKMAADDEQMRQNTTKAFTDIQRQTMAMLKMMGFSGAEAKSIVGGAEAGSGAIVDNAVRMGPKGLRQAEQYGAMKGDQMAKRAQGGRVMGGPSGLRRDSVMIGPNTMAAPNELVVAGHTESKVDKLLSVFGTSLDREVRNNKRPHNLFAKGGRLSAGASLGHPELQSGIANATRSLLSHFPGLQVTSTTGGTHAGGSYHYKGQAVDIAGPSGLMNQASSWIKTSGMFRSLAEGIHNPNLAVKFGKLFSGAGPFGGVWAGHTDHIHMAVAGAMRAMMAQAPHIGRKNMGGAGLRGAMGQQAADIGVKGANRLLKRMYNKTGGGIGMESGAGSFKGSGNISAAQRLGHQMMLRAGFPSSEWPSLLTLWNKESGWNPYAVNPSSGASGIPQALGHGNVFGLGDARGQIKWGLNYIRERYGSPSAALAFHNSHNWYNKGGRIKQMGRGGSFIARHPQMIEVGDRQPEKVSVKPVHIGGSRKGGGNGGIHFDIEIGQIVYNGRGDVKKAIERELREVAHDLADGSIFDEDEMT